MPAYIRPPLKWPGGKFRLLDRIRAALPPGKRLVEPFVGSGVVFLNTDYPEYLLCDDNGDLVNFYRCLLQEKTHFIKAAAVFFSPRNNTPEAYNALRARFNQLPPGTERAALFLYLNRHGYNGLVRYNGKGLFNTPFGRYTAPRFPALMLENLVRKSARCRVRFMACDFRETFGLLRPGDVVYCDPPYVPLSTTARFTAYTRDRFGLEEQRALAACALDAAARGHSVLISNHDTDFSRGIYDKARISRFSVQRSISCKQRQKAPELLALFDRPAPFPFPAEQAQAL